MIYNLYKKRGETPLECLERFKKQYTGENVEKEKMTYLGRLDPLAEGVLLVATGDDVYKKEEFLNLDKEYEFGALFQFATDTYDIMGKIVDVKKDIEIKEMDLIKIVKLFEGERNQEYPIYSSKMISKRKSFHDNLESDLEPLYKKVNIFEIKFKNIENYSNTKLFNKIFLDISSVNGDFRQKEIINDWQKILIENKNSKGFLVGHFSAKVSSGTYIRSLVNDMGKTLGVLATTLYIKRVSVGDYKIENSLIF